MTVSEEKFMRITAAVMSDETPLAVQINIKEAWLLISALQLAIRHPGLSPVMKQTLKKIARDFQQPITQRHPETARLFEMGWHPAYDREKEK
jgi:hypothetical protein